MIINADEREMETLRILARSGAKKICGFGKCYSTKACDHENNDGFLMHHADENAGFDMGRCPLADYNISPDHRSFSKVPYTEWQATKQEMTALCALCAFSECKVKEPEALDSHGYLEIEFSKPSYADDSIMHCMNCPVQMAEEGQQEAEAESYCS